MENYKIEKIKKIEKLIIDLKEKEEKILNEMKKDLKNILSFNTINNYQRKYNSLKVKINDLELLINILEEDTVNDFKEEMKINISREENKINKIQTYKKQLEEIIKK